MGKSLESAKGRVASIHPVAERDCPKRGYKRRCERGYDCIRKAKWFENLYLAVRRAMLDAHPRLFRRSQKGNSRKPARPILCSVVHEYSAHVTNGSKLK